MNKHLQQLGVIVGACAMMACTTMQPLSVDSARNTLNRGDRVEVITTQGLQLHFAVDSIDDQGLHGGGQTVAYSDIQSISRKEGSTGRTTALVLGVLAVGALAAGGGSGGGSGGMGGY